MAPLQYTNSSLCWDTGDDINGLSSTSGTAVTGTWSNTVTTDSYVRVLYEPQQYHQYETFSGVNIQLDIVENNKKVIHPRLYFALIKSKLTKLEERKLNKRLLLLQKFVKSAEDMGQQALYEEFARKIAITVREQELWACGIEYFVDKEIVLNYMDKVKDVEIGFVKREKFDRPLPDNVQKRLNKFKDLKLFDEFWILHLNYKHKKDVDGKKKKEKKLKTNKEKIKEKDPILFGVQSFMPNKLYYIIDWIDDHCDLTLDKFIEDVKKSDPNYDVDKLEEIDEKYIQKLVKQSRERYKRLGDTNPDNYKAFMKEEDKLTKTSKNIAKKAQGIFKDMEDKFMTGIKKIKKKGK